MADEKDNQTQKDAQPQQGSQPKPDAAEKKDEKKSFIGRFLPWIIMAVVIIFSAGAGLGIGKLFASMKKPAAEPNNAPPPSQPETLHLTAEGAQKNWYYSLEPVIANLDEPSVTRYIRVTLTLEINGQVEKEEGTVFIDEKKPLLTNWLTIYLAGLTIEDIRGDKNLRRIQSEVLDSFNEKLFPNAKPQIVSILFKEFAVQ